MIDFLRMRKLIRQVPKAAFAVEQAEARATCGAITYSDMPKAQGAGDKLERDVITVMELRAAYLEIVVELERMKKELKPYIDDLANPEQKAVMRLRYLDGQSPEVIANSSIVPMSRMTVYRALRSGEDAIRQKLVLNI